MDGLYREATRSLIAGTRHGMLPPKMTPGKPVEGSGKATAWIETMGIPGSLYLTLRPLRSSIVAGYIGFERLHPEETLPPDRHGTKLAGWSADAIQTETSLQPNHAERSPGQE